MRWRPTPPANSKYKKSLFKDFAATADFIYQIGELDALRLPSTGVKVAKITSPEYKAKFAYLKKCIRTFRRLTGKGRGLAAVQVGIPERFFLLYTPSEKEAIEIVINPRVIKVASKKYSYPEQCMSCNGLIAEVTRPAWVELEYYTETGSKKVWNTKDTSKSGRMYNRVIQHELDHLVGIINIDKVLSRELIFESSKEFYEKAIFKEVHQADTGRKGKITE